VLEHWQLWGMLPFFLACALGPWVNSKDTESVSIVRQLPFILLAFGGFVGVPWLLWREYREGGLGHAALMFASAFCGAVVLGLLFGLAVAFTARRLAARSSVAADAHMRNLRTYMQVIAVVVAPWTAYSIYVATK
jgi:hypothetical protein